MWAGDQEAKKMSDLSSVPAINDRGYVQSEYRDDARLAARMAFWKARTGPQPQDVALDVIRKINPSEALEVGCGQGQFAAELRAAGIDVTAVDQSAAMVQLTGSRGVRAQVADIETLPFANDSFDLVAANYVLYHVTDLTRGLSEIARVLRPGGALVAVTNSQRKLKELWDLVGSPGDREKTFNSENGASVLGPHFASVDRHDVEERFVVTERAVRDYIAATAFAAAANRVPPLSEGLVVTAAGSVFVAMTATVGAA
jgi:SAM-dependent methyltransferase